MENEIRILLADDDSIIREGLASLLNHQDGLNVVATAANGAQVFDQLLLHRVDAFRRGYASDERDRSCSTYQRRIPSHANYYAHCVRA